ncbi:MAG: hypothetical protein O3C23_02145 [bacterium]|nr:hypothetical protein [bacterium]
MKVSLCNLRKGIIPSKLSSNGGLPKLTTEGKITAKDIRKAAFFFGFPMLLKIGKKNYILGCEEDVDVLLNIISYGKSIKLTLERPAFMPKMKSGK